MSDRDLIAEGRAKLADLEASHLDPADRDFYFGMWARQWLPSVLDALEAAQRPPIGYVVGYLDDDEEDGEVFRRWTDSLITDRGVADRRMKEAQATGEPWQLLEVREVPGV